MLRNSKSAIQYSLNVTEKQRGQKVAMESLAGWIKYHDEEYLNCKFTAMCLRTL